MNLKIQVRRNLWQGLLLTALLACSGLAQTATKAADIKSTPQEAEAKAIRPAMPDGLYLVDRDVPFLLIEEGQWVDPYEWVEKNGIEALNTKYVQGQRFERFHIHTQLGSFEGMKLYSLSATDMLKSSKILNKIKFDLKKLAPRISAERCEDNGKDLWHCNTEGVITSYALVSMRCNTGQGFPNCPKGISSGEAAANELLKERGSKSLLRLNSDILTRKIGLAYSSMQRNPLAHLTLVKVEGGISQIFLGAENVRMVSGMLDLYFKAKPTWKRKDKWQTEPIGSARISFIWDTEKEKFVYIQKHVPIFSTAAQSVCERGLEPHYCPASRLMGMWEINGKTYAAIRHEQHLALWHYPPSQPMNDLDRKGVVAAQIEVIEVGQESAPVIFSTRQFIATY